MIDYSIPTIGIDYFNYTIKKDDYNPPNTYILKPRYQIKNVDHFKQ